MNSVRSIACYDCEHNLTEFQKTHSKDSFNTALNEFRRLKTETDEKISQLKNRINPLAELPEKIEEIYLSFEKMDSLKTRIKEFPNSQFPVYVLDLIFLSASFFIYNAVMSPSASSSWYSSFSTTPAEYSVSTHPLTAGLLVLEAIQACILIFIHQERHDLKLDDKSLNFFKILHKINRFRFFNQNQYLEFLKIAKESYDILPQEIKDKMQNWNEWEKDIKKQLSITS